ncbi:MAG TPA: choice-of-anchor Q domain-containing protein [Marmoricola sp.]|nr:choice-of-anchor Q domain-containing protein [Marmoricola sp.]
MMRTMSRSIFAVALAVATLEVGGISHAASTRPVTFVVNAFNDAIDAHPGDGQCRTVAGTCTLRAAVQEADASSSTPHVIVLPAGRISMSIKTKWPLPSQTVDLKTDPAYGELNIDGNVTVIGKSASRTVIAVNGIDRGFSVQVGGFLALRDLTITGANARVNDHTPGDIAIGGAVLNNGGLVLERVALIGNEADGGGGVFSIPLTTIAVRDSLIANNRAVEGGGLRLDGGGLIVNTTITGNRLFTVPFAKVLPDQITGYGGGIDHRGTGQVVIVNSTITNNSAIKAGGGYNSGMGYAPLGPLTSIWPYRTTLFNTVIANNTVNGRGENCHVADMIIQSLGHNLSNDGSCFLHARGDLPNRGARLGRLGRNGGPTETQMPLPGSPLIDHGANKGCPAHDQRGVPRPQGHQCDIGAVEVRR